MNPKKPTEVKKMRKSTVKKSLAIGFAVAILGVGTAYTQFVRGGGTDWNASGVDAQRTSWFRTDRFISVEAFQNGGFKLQWKIKVNNQPRELTSIVGATTSGGGLTKPLDVINSTNNTLTTVDNDTGIVGWVRHFDVAAPSASTLACPGGMTANSSRPVNLEPPAPPAARGANPLAGRGGAQYESYVGQPGQGLPDGVAVRSLNGFRGPARGPVAPPTYKIPFGAGRYGSGYGFYVVTSDGVLHTVADGNGVDIQPPVNFLPANAHASDLIAIPENNDKWHSYVVYASTMNGCGGVANGVWAVNLADDAMPISHVETGGSPLGPPAFSPDGTLYVSIGKGSAGAAYSNAIIALEPKTLTVKDYFTDPKADFATPPTVVKQGDRELVAAATADGRIYLLDASSLGGSDHKTPLYVSKSYSTAKTDYAPPALASWEDADGNAWILEPFAGTASNGNTNGGIVSLKLVDDAGKPSLTEAWVSPDMTSPLAPVIINGVVFAASSGEYHPRVGASMSAAERAKMSSPAVLYSLDAATGKQLWSSGKEIASFVAGTPLWASVGQVYAATYDNIVYAFGFPMERYVNQGQ
jgi:hypothetical protein